MRNKSQLVTGLLILFFQHFLVACSPTNNPEVPSTPSTATPTLANLTPISSRVPPTLTITPTPSLTPTFTLTSTLEYVDPEGCLKPGDDYDLVSINGMVINQRTYEMLQHAQSIYQGEIELTGYHLTQGSYSNLVSASFGTHDGGGAVDLSVIQYGTYQILYEDIKPLINALRVAGFAAWLRDFDQLYVGSPIHIHAIAIGDRDLSAAAKDQLTGEYGYFRGFNGIPQPSGYPPIEDEYGGPIICQWMFDIGYVDLRSLYP